MFRIRDLQVDKYFWDGYWFKDKKEALEALTDFHSIDVNNEWLNSMDLNDVMLEFGWTIER